MAKRLDSAVAVRNVKTPGRHHTGDTLYLMVWPSARKSWVQRLTIEGKRKDLGLGPYPAVSLAEARQRAQDNLSPLGAKQEEAKLSAVPTFEDLARQRARGQQPGGTAPVHCPAERGSGDGRLPRPPRTLWAAQGIRQPALRPNGRDGRSPDRDACAHRRLPHRPARGRRAVRWLPVQQRDRTLPVAEALVARGDSAASPEDRLRASASCRRGTALADAS